jgi:hypothetical protein
MGDRVGDENGGDWHFDPTFEAFQKLPGSFALPGERLDLYGTDG